MPISLLHVLVFAAAATVGPGLGRRQGELPSDFTLYAVVFSLAVLAALPGWYLFIRDARANPNLSPEQRKRWTVMLMALPQSLVAYWWIHVYRAAASD
jgi:hypothetical protein